MLKIEDLNVGDILLRESQEIRIQAICGELIFLSIWGEPNKAGSAITIQQLNENGYKLKPDHPDFKVDQPLMVRDHNGEKRRLFAFVKDKLLYCWCDGNTKWTSKGSAAPWDNYRLPTQEELNS